MPLLHPSIADIPEKELIARVLSDPHYRQTLLNIKGLVCDDASILTEVELRAFRRDLAGDVDILVVPRHSPEQSTAIQVKRFKAKVGLDDAHTGHPLRLGEVFEKGVRQTNDLAKIGFSQVYLWVFIAIDTREQNLGEYRYDGADSLLRSRIDHAISAAHLDGRVGLMKFEWTQPMDRPPFELGTYGGSLDRLAGTASQPDALTDRLKTLIDGGR
jgi:hypothetical protein